MQYLQAKNYTSRPASRGVRMLVIHTTESGQVKNAAMNSANWFASQPKRGEIYNGKPWGGSSAHFCIDDAGVVQCVLENDIAWHAGPVNDYSIGMEHVGYSAKVDWNNAYSQAMLRHSAQLAATLCEKYGIPVERLTAEDLAAGKRDGFTGHVDITRGLKSGDHTDPGERFPWSEYLDLVRSFMAPPSSGGGGGSGSGGGPGTWAYAAGGVLLGIGAWGIWSLVKR